jgi:hypothetical protein
VGKPLVEELPAIYGEQAGAGIGSMPTRSSRVTRIATRVMISASARMPAETRKPSENPVASAWS